MRNFTAVWVSLVVQSCSPVQWSRLVIIDAPKKLWVLFLAFLLFTVIRSVGQICSPEDKHAVAVKLLEQTVGHNYAKRALQSVLILLET